MIRYDYSQPYVTRDEYLEVKGVDLNIELQDDDNHSNKVNRFIQDITNFVLDHLVMEYNCNELNRQFNEFEDLAEFRRVRFHYGMLEEIEYVLSNGLIQLDSGINRETGSITDFSGLVIGSSALKQFRLAGFCNKQEGTGHRGDLSPKDMPTIEELVLELGKKVDKVDGKGLSANDYTTADKTLLRSVAQELNDKVDKEEGKKLTTNDFTDAYKNKVDGIEAGAQRNIIEEVRVNNEPLTITGKAVNIDAAPIIANKEDKANKVTELTSESTDEQYPSAKCVYEETKSTREIAEGKTNTFSVNPATSGNEGFQNGDSEITVTSFVDVNGNTIIVNQLKKGDLVFTLNGQNVKYADRWLVDPVAGTWGLIDADTPDLSGYVTTGTEQTVTGNKRLFNAFLSFLNSQASGNAEYVLEENQYGQFTISCIYNNIKSTLWLFDGRTFLPSSDNQNDIGSSNRRVKDGHFAGQVYAENTFNVLLTSSCFTSGSTSVLTDDAFAKLINGKPTLLLKDGNVSALTYGSVLIPPLKSVSTSICRVFGLTDATDLICVVINPNDKSISLGSANSKFLSLRSIWGFNGKEVPAYPSSPTEDKVLTYGTDNTLKWGDGIYNVINASDIVNNTLTQAQYDLITNGKPTLISGAFLGLTNAIYFTPQNNGTVWRGLLIGCETGTTTIIVKAYELVISTKAILISSSRRIRIDIDQLNGKTIPSYPSSPTNKKFFTYFTDGTLGWDDPIANNGFNVINASDITNNTLTEEQYALITNGYPTLIKGTFLNRINPILLTDNGGTSTRRGFMFAGVQVIGFAIDVSTKVVSLSNTTASTLNLASIGNFNGKDVPAYPSSPTSPKYFTYTTGNALNWGDLDYLKGKEIPALPESPAENRYLALKPNNTFDWVSAAASQIDVPANQAYTCIVQNALKNINGKNLTSFTSTQVTVGGYSAIKILKNGNKLTESEAATYMQAQTGSSFVPKYDLDKPQYTYFIFATGSIYKVQWDSTNGLLLYYVNQLAFNSQINSLRDEIGCTEVDAPASSSVFTQQEFEAIHDGKAHYVGTWGNKSDVYIFPNSAQPSQGGVHNFVITYQTSSGDEVYFDMLMVNEQSLQYSFGLKKIRFVEGGYVYYDGSEIINNTTLTNKLDAAFEGGKTAYKTLETVSGEVKTNSSSGVSYTIPEAYRNYAVALNITWKLGTTTINNTSYTAIYPLPPIRIAALGTLNAINIDDSYYLEIVKSSVSFNIIVRRHSDDAVVSGGELYIWLS